MAVPKFTSRGYYVTSIEHLGTTTSLHKIGQYFTAHYFAGVAAEAMLRALSSGEEDQFDNSHSIEYWAKKANLLPTGPEEKQDNFRARLFDLNLRWRANQRYYNMKMLDTWLHNINLDGRVRGDRVKVSTERMLELANEIVGLGVNRWNKKS